MAMTPEGKVKAAITKKLKEMGCWYYMPVGSGYGTPTVDYLCAYEGRAFGIEAKAPDKRPTPRQLNTMLFMGKLGVPSIVVDSSSEDKMEHLEAWILMVCASRRAGGRKNIWVEGNTQSEENVWGTDNERE